MNECVIGVWNCFCSVNDRDLLNFLCKSPVMYMYVVQHVREYILVSDLSMDISKSILFTKLSFSVLGFFCTHCMCIDSCRQTAIDIGDVIV